MAYLNINLGIQQKYNFKDDYNCFGHCFILWSPQCIEVQHTRSIEMAVWSRKELLNLEKKKKKP